MPGRIDHPTLQSARATIISTTTESTRIVFHAFRNVHLVLINLLIVSLAVILLNLHLIAFALLNSLLIILAYVNHVFPYAKIVLHLLPAINAFLMLFYLLPLILANALLILFSVYL